jgi:hypothetical protein
MWVKGLLEKIVPCDISKELQEGLNLFSALGYDDATLHKAIRFLKATKELRDERKTDDS